MPNSTARANRRTSRYRTEARDSGVRPSQSSPSTAPPRASAIACGERRPGGGRSLRRGATGSAPGDVVTSGCVLASGRLVGEVVTARVVGAARFVSGVLATSRLVAEVVAARLVAEVVVGRPVRVIGPERVLVLRGRGCP